METPFCKIVVSDQVDPNTAILISPHQFRGDLADWDSMIKQWLAETGAFCMLVNVGDPDYDPPEQCHFCGWKGKKSEMIKVPDQTSPSQPPKKTTGYRCPKCGKMVLYDGV